MTAIDPHLKTYLLDDPETGPEERVEIEAHLESCGPCRDSLAYYRRARRLVKASARVPEEGRFVSEVMERVGGPTTLSVTRRRSGWAFPAALAGAILSVFVALFFLTQPDQATTRDLLASGDEGDFYEWATDAGALSEDDVLAFVIDDFEGSSL